jgi:DNA-binding CsgD family transcriptional regulator
VSYAELDLHGYVRDLEEHLKATLFGGGVTVPEVAVLLVRGALAAGDESKAAELAWATERLAAVRSADPGLATVAAHVRGLVERDPSVLDRAARGYAAAADRAWALEDAGIAWAEQGNQGDAVARLRQAHALFEQLGSTASKARVRSRLRAAGIRTRHWTQLSRPAFGWDSLTDSERQIVDLVARGLSNREAASQMFLSVHTVSFHLRSIFRKLDVTSRVQLARLAADRYWSGPATTAGSGSAGVRVDR